MSNGREDPWPATATRERRRDWEPCRSSRDRRCCRSTCTCSHRISEPVAPLAVTLPRRRRTWLKLNPHWNFTFSSLFERNWCFVIINIFGLRFFDYLEVSCDFFCFGLLRCGPCEGVSATGEFLPLCKLQKYPYESCGFSILDWEIWKL